MACWKPSPTWPNTFSAGIRQSSRITSAVSLARMPNLFSFLPAFSPAVPRSTTNAVMPLLSKSSPVRAMITITSLLLPWVIQHLVPFSTHSFPSLRAVHFMRMASLPVLGSVSAQAPSH